MIKILLLTLAIHSCTSVYIFCFPWLSLPWYNGFSQKFWQLLCVDLSGPAKPMASLKMMRNTCFQNANVSDPLSSSAQIFPLQPYLTSAWSGI